MPIRVVIIEDVREVREGLKMLIDGTGGFQCAANFRTMEDALARHRRHQARRHPHGYRAARDGRHRRHAPAARAFPDVPILALTVYDDDDNVFNAICAGASGTS